MGVRVMKQPTTEGGQGGYDPLMVLGWDVEGPGPEGRSPAESEGRGARSRMWTWSETGLEVHPESSTLILGRVPGSDESEIVLP